MQFIAVELVIAMTMVSIASASVAHPDLSKPADPFVRIGRSRIAPGTHLTVPVRLGRAPQIGAAEMELVYDAAAVQLVSISKGQLLGETATLEADLSTPGRARIRIESELEPLSGNGVLFRAQFGAPENAAQAGYPLTLEDARAWRMDGASDGSHPDGEMIKLVAIPGVLRIVPGPVPLWVLACIAGVFLVVLAHSLWTKPPRFIAAMRRKPAEEPLLDEDFVVEHAGAD